MTTLTPALIATLFAIIGSLLIVNYLDRKASSLSTAIDVTLQMCAMFAPFFVFVGALLIMS